VSFRLALVLVVLAAGSVGCKSRPEEQRPAARDEAPMQPEEPEEPEPPVVLTPIRPEPPVSNKTPTAAQLPVAEDFQLETTTTIVRANYLNELERLEADVRADGN
jgi:hypothetical protein